LTPTKIRRRCDDALMLAAALSVILAAVMGLL
jgi:hypothetical protein